MDDLCTLQYAVGRTELCPRARCPFWDDDTGCVIHPIDRDVVEQPALAQHLLELRLALERARQRRDLDGTPRLFYRLG